VRFDLVSMESWGALIFVTWLVMSVPAYLLLLSQNWPTGRRIFGALLVAVMVAHCIGLAGVEGAFAQPANNPCDNCHEWWCVLLGCF